MAASKDENTKRKQKQSAAPSDERDTPHRVAMATLASQFNNGKRLLSYNGAFHHYHEGYWQPIDDNAVASRILATMAQMQPSPNGSTTAITAHALGIMKIMQAQSTNPFLEFNRRAHIINCRNGEIWLSDDDSIDFRPHEPASFLDHRLKVDYDPKATCPIYDKTRREIFAGSSDPKAMRRHCNELGGYILQPRRPFAIVLVLYGTGRNGKTLLIKVITELLGPSLVYVGPVASLGNDRWAVAHLAGKRVYVDDDVAKDCIVPDAILKTISEEKILTGERKYRDKAEVLCAVVPVLLCNNLPVLQDISEGMKRRLQVVPFERTFTGNLEDAFLLAKIRDQELSGVLNRMLEGLQRLIKRGRFRIPDPVKQATARWISSANVVERFLKSKCKVDPAESAWGQHLYKALQQFLADEGVRSCPTRQSFYNDLEHKGFRHKHGRKGEKFSGIVLR